MKVYLSADIEGVACISAPSECDMSHADYPPFRAQMTAEVVQLYGDVAAVRLHHIAAQAGNDRVVADPDD